MRYIENITMDRELIELNADEAREVLRAYLELERRVFAELEIDEIDLDFSKASVIQAIRYVAINEFGKISEFDMNRWFAKLGFYFGESLCRSAQGLRWDIGNSETPFANHPVIAGFDSGEEAAVITICRNILLATVRDGARSGRILDAVEYWFSLDSIH
ncbi:MAG: hypothetical protein K1X35_06490 [Caulobacteraceae bacterium]|nr:hypothetical protein [Caulobacteraceae bacterium]